MNTMYALKIRKSDAALVTFLHDGVPIKIMSKSTKNWLVFVVEDDGKHITSKVVTERELHRDYEIAGHSPFIARLKK